MKKFSARTRKNRLREIKTLRDRGQVDLLRVSQPSEIDAFLETAREISQRTWQFKHFGGGLAARDLDVVRRELRFLAERGWLRSYVLKCPRVPLVLDPRYIDMIDFPRRVCRCRRCLAPLQRRHSRTAVSSGKSFQ